MQLLAKLKNVLQSGFRVTLNFCMGFRFITHRNVVMQLAAHAKKNQLSMPLNKEYIKRKHVPCFYRVIKTRVEV